ncbi:MAG: hypothetical protein R3C39_08820 [Dehalococcoidia bacterium]
MRRTALAAFALTSMLAVACSSEATPTSTPTPTTEATSTIETASTSASPPVEGCPVETGVCQLAIEMLPVVRAADAATLAQQAVTQMLECVENDDGSEDPVRLQVAEVCAAVRPVGSVEVFELNNGRAPLYFHDRSMFSDELSVVLSAMVSPSTEVALAAVGCGRATEAAGDECFPVALYRVHGEPTPLYIGLVFAPASGVASGLQKVWLPFPGQIPDPPARVSDVSIPTATGAALVDVAPFSTAE